MARFRLTLTYCALFVGFAVVLLGLIYWQTAGYMSGQVDQILDAEAKGFETSTPERLPDWIREDMARDVRHINFYGLFSADGVWILGNIQAYPSDLAAGGPPRQLKAADGLRPGARALAIRLPWGEQLVVGRDVTQLAEIRHIILRALFWSGAFTITAGLALAGAVSVPALRRIAQIQAVTQVITDGDFAARLAVTRRHDELDMLASTVNRMLDEVQRLVAEIKSAGDSLAHDLRTPLNRLSASLHRLQQQTPQTDSNRALIDQALAETESLLTRFQAMLRIAEIESGARRAGFRSLDPADLVAQIEDLFEPLAAERGIAFTSEAPAGQEIHADPELLFEALANLVDNAIKFTPPGGRVALRLARVAEGPRLEVVDNGPGVASGERSAVLQRFYRSDRDRLRPGSGLGLSIVAAIMRLHGFDVVLTDAEPGLRVVMDFWRKVDGAAPATADN